MSVRSTDSLNAFQQLLERCIFRSPEVPNHFVLDQRISSVYHCRTRNDCDNLNKDLFNNHLRPTAACECGFESEDSEHYFFSPVIGPHSNGLVYSRPSVNFSLILLSFISILDTRFL